MSAEWTLDGRGRTSSGVGVIVGIPFAAELLLLILSDPEVLAGALLVAVVVAAPVVGKGSSGNYITPIRLSHPPKLLHSNWVLTSGMIGRFGAPPNKPPGTKPATAFKLTFTSMETSPMAMLDTSMSPIATLTSPTIKYVSIEGGRAEEEVERTSDVDIPYPYIGSCVPQANVYVLFVLSQREVFAAMSQVQTYLRKFRQIGLQSQSKPNNPSAPVVSPLRRTHEIWQLRYFNLPLAPPTTPPEICSMGRVGTYVIVAEALFSMRRFLLCANTRARGIVVGTGGKRARIGRLLPGTPDTGRYAHYHDGKERRQMHRRRRSFRSDLRTTVGKEGRPAATQNVA